MNTGFNDKVKNIKNHINDPLFKNSYFLMANTAIYAGVGFIFWIVAARVYSTAEVGIGSAIVSVMGLLSIFALMGFDISLIRYVPTEEKKGIIINTCLTTTTAVSILLAIIFLAGLDIWAPALNLLNNNFFYEIAFIIFTVFSALSMLQISIFAAFRAAKYSFFQSLTNFLRLLLLPFLLIFGSFGIFAAFGLTYAITFIVGNKFISKVDYSYKMIPTIKKSVIQKMFHYSFRNYITNIFTQIPTYILPLLVVNLLSPEMNAYFYVAWTFSLILLTVPVSISKSLLAEGSFSQKEFSNKVIQSLKFTLILLITAIIGILIFGKYLLLLFGENYALNSFNLLIILCIASIPYSIVQIYATTKRLQKNINELIVIFSFIASATIIGSFFLLQKFGIISIGYMWLASNGIVALYILFKKISTRHSVYI